MNTKSPVRLQRSRAKGSRLTSPNGLPIVCVGRPSKWGNPLSANEAVGRTKEDAVRFFRTYIEKAIASYRPNCDPQYRGLNINELRGKNLACWCKPGEPCHADVLLELANKPTLEDACH